MSQVAGEGQQHHASAKSGGHETSGSVSRATKMKNATHPKKSSDARQGMTTRLRSISSASVIITGSDTSAEHDSSGEGSSKLAEVENSPSESVDPDATIIAQDSGSPRDLVTSELGGLALPPALQSLPEGSPTLSEGLFNSGIVTFERALREELLPMGSGSSMRTDDSHAAPVQSAQCQIPSVVEEMAVEEGAPSGGQAFPEDDSVFVKLLLSGTSQFTNDDSVVGVSDRSRTAAPQGTVSPAAVGGSHTGEAVLPLVASYADVTLLAAQTHMEAPPSDPTRRRTVRFMLQSRSAYLDMFKAIAEQTAGYVCLRELRAASTTDGGHFEIAGRCYEDAVFLSQWLVSLSYITSVVHLGALRTRVTVTGMPVDLEGHHLVAALQPYGEVHSCDYVLLHGVRMSTRIVTMSIRKAIPRAFQVRGASLTVRYDQQPLSCPICGDAHSIRACTKLKCFRCNGTHMAWACKEVPCNKCLQFGHSRTACRGTAATSHTVNTRQGTQHAARQHAPPHTAPSRNHNAPPSSVRSSVHPDRSGACQERAVSRSGSTTSLDSSVTHISATQRHASGDEADNETGFQQVTRRRSKRQKSRRQAPPTSEARLARRDRDAGSLNQDLASQFRRSPERGRPDRPSTRFRAAGTSYRGRSDQPSSQDQMARWEIHNSADGSVDHGRSNGPADSERSNRPSNQRQPAAASGSSSSSSRGKEASIASAPETCREEDPNDRRS